MIKNLPPKALDFYVELIQEFWRDDKMDFGLWHVTILNMLYKGKGDLQDPTNHCGIALEETSAKVLCIIIAK
jgi:hypothetical protein